MVMTVRNGLWSLHWHFLSILLRNLILELQLVKLVDVVRNLSNSSYTPCKHIYVKKINSIKHLCFYFMSQVYVWYSKWLVYDILLHSNWEHSCCIVYEMYDQHYAYITLTKTCLSNNITQIHTTGIPYRLI